MTGTIQLSALDHHFAEFITALDRAPAPELWLAAALASAAASRGHVCVDLAEGVGATIVPFDPASGPLSPPAPEQWQRSLSACSTVGRPGEFVPLVLDGAGRLYLHRSWDYERQVAAAILERVVPVEPDRDLLERGLACWFPPCGETPDWQRVAAVAAVSRRLTVISGGPGTGKTSTVARILALLIEQAGERTLQIALAAPTGKAAMRLRHSILEAAQRMDLTDRLRERIPVGVQTLHRLLGAAPAAGAPRHNADNPLPCDVLVVDEVSMVDLPMMTRLLEALQRETVLILLGDRDQLASVEAGAVLADICNRGGEAPFSAHFRQLVEPLCGPLPSGPAASPAAPAPLADAVVQLRTSYRFGAESGIGHLSRMIQEGQAEAALELLQSGGYPDLAWNPLPNGPAFEAAFADAVDSGYRAYGLAATPAEALRELERFRVLSPHRQGPFGIQRLNRLIQHRLGLMPPSGRQGCFQAVMMTGNNYELGLFNGDTAVVEPGERGTARAWFPDPELGLRHLSSLRLPPGEPAYCLTVHKSQGSEFERVLLILPDRFSELLSRELLYTAVTRARTSLEIWGLPEVFCQGVARRTVRNSGLRDRLWGEQT